MWNTKEKYGVLAKIFHWGAGTAYICILAVGFIMINIPNDNKDKYELYALHKAFGMLLLGVTLIRLSWKFLNSAPVYTFTISTFEKLISKVSHFLLYASMIIMPLTGYVASTAADYNISFFKLFEFPKLITKNKSLAKLSNEIHEKVAYIFIILIIFHIVAAFYHHFYRKDTVLTRMLPESFSKKNF